MAKSYTYGSQTVSFNEFDLDTIIYNENREFLNPRIALIGKSGSGKSWIIRNIMHYMKDVPTGTVIAPTDKMNKFYNSFICPSFIHHYYKEDIVPKILTRQKKILLKNEERVHADKKPVDPRTFLIMDDCMSSKKLWLNDPSILTIFNEGRHYQLTFILAMQYSLGIQPELRSNFDFIFMLGDDMYSNRKRLYEHYAGIFPSRDVFEQVFCQMTDNWGCMVINNRIRSLDISKKVFWFRAKSMPSFVVGSRKYLKWHTDNYDEDYDKKDSILDLGALVARRKTNITVKLV